MSVVLHRSQPPASTWTASARGTRTAANARSDVAVRQAARLGAADRRAEDAARSGSGEGAGGLRSRSVERRGRDLARAPARVPRALPRRDRRLHARHRAAPERGAPLPPPRAPLHHDAEVRRGDRRSAESVAAGRRQAGRGRAGRRPEQGRHPAQHAAVEHLVSPRPRAVPARRLSRPRWRATARA